MCRQVLAEFCTELPIYLASPNGERIKVMLSAIFPHNFDRTLLASGQTGGEGTS